MSRSSQSARAPVEQTGRRRRPGVDTGACSKCGACVEIAPEIFSFSEAHGFIEIRDLEHYDVEQVEEAIKYCPEDCISWEDAEPDVRGKTGGVVL